MVGWGWEMAVGCEEAWGLRLTEKLRRFNFNRDKEDVILTRHRDWDGLRS